MRFPCRMTACATTLRTASARDTASIGVSCPASMRCVSCTAARSCRTFHFLAGCVALMKDSQSVEVRPVVIRTSRWSEVGMATVWYVMGLTFPQHREETRMASRRWHPLVCPACTDPSGHSSCSGSYRRRFRRSSCQNRLGVLLQIESLKSPMSISYWCVSTKASCLFLVAAVWSP